MAPFAEYTRYFCSSPVPNLLHPTLPPYFTLPYPPSLQSHSLLPYHDFLVPQVAFPVATSPVCASPSLSLSPSDTSSSMSFFQALNDSSTAGSVSDSISSSVASLDSSPDAPQDTLLVVPVHSRHEYFTVVPYFPGSFERYVMPDLNGVQHVCVSLASFGSQVAYNMYRVWLSNFGELFSVSGQHWALVPCQVGQSKPTQLWRTFTATAKIRFRCQCENAWTSMHGVVMFQYYLRRDIGCGTVMVQWPSQACAHCHSPCPPMWYPKEVRRVLGELRNRVFQKIYPGNAVTPLVFPRQPGYPRGSHRRDLCVGCQSGSCMSSRSS